MTWITEHPYRSAACIAIMLAAAAVPIWSLGWRRGIATVVHAYLIAWGAIAVPWGLRALGAETASWWSLALVCPALWLGQTPVGLLNFLVLQWFGLRLTPTWDSVDGTVRGRWWSMNAPRGVPVRWTLQRGVWPLTGWIGHGRRAS